MRSMHRSSNCLTRPCAANPSPLAAGWYAIDLVGPDATALTLEPPPEFASQAMAAEMTELYWRALMRDVPFREYDSNPLVPAAIADLGALGYGQLSTTSLFRGETAGDRREIGRAH